MPWANGRGVSHEVARGEGDVGKWNWRVAIAPIHEDGPFSSLPGVHRELTVLEGEGLVLTIDGVEVPVGTGEVVRFAGSSVTHAALTSGPVVDVNVMSREGSEMSMSIERGPVEIDRFSCLVALDAGVVAIDGQETHMEPRDALVGFDSPVRLVAGRVAVVRPSR